jgi:hypothetical protein
MFVNLLRACRLARSWLAALELHGARPDLVSFDSASEVVAACSLAGFPLTKIQLWLKMADANLFLVSAEQRQQQEAQEQTSSPRDEAEKEASNDTSSLSVLDISVFFALLNAQSHGGAESSSTLALSQNAWRRSLELLQTCWLGKSSASSSSGDGGVKETSLSSAAAAFDAARAPDCVASVIDTCIRQQQWQRAFALFTMQRLLLVPLTPHAVFLLLTAMLDRVAPAVSSSSTTSSSFSWRQALWLVSDAVQRSDSANRVLQPLVCERLVQVLCRGGAWQRALAFAWSAGPSMGWTGNLLTNDRVLDALVKHSDNAEVVCRAALASGTFPVGAQHSLASRVVDAATTLLDAGQQRAAAEGDRSLAWKTLSSTIKHGSRNLPPTVIAKMRLAELRGSCSSSPSSSQQSSVPSRAEIEKWLSVVGHESLPAQVACDVAFAKLLFAAQLSTHNSENAAASRQQQMEQALLMTSAEALLRYALLFGAPTRNELASEWPARLAHLTQRDFVPEAVSKLLRDVANDLV